MEKVRYIAGIHTCKDYWANVPGFVWESDWFKYLESRKDVKIVYLICDGEFPANAPHKDAVYLPCKEDYGQLADKTYKFVKWACDNYQFKYLLKFDDNKTFLEPEVFMDVLDKNTADYIVSNIHKTSLRKFIQWFKTRSNAVNVRYLDSQATYSCWKPYAMSKRFCDIVSEIGAEYARIYVNYLAGCEDHMIGKIFKDYNNHKIINKKKYGKRLTMFDLPKKGRYNIQAVDPGRHAKNTIHIINKNKK